MSVDPDRPTEQGAQPAAGIAPPAQIRTALTIFRVAAIIAGLALFVLIGEMILKYVFDNPVLTWWSPVHGLIFMGFVVATANLGFKVGWGVGRMILTMLLACLPFVAFVEERRVVREVEPLTHG